MKFGEGQKLEFIAKTVTDIGKAVFIVGLASRFFEQFSIALRIVVSFMSIAFIVTGVFLYPDKGEGK